MIEPPTHRMLELNWKNVVRMDAGGGALLPPTFVAEQGQLVRILDVRTREELTGALGHIPAVTHVPMDQLANVPRVLGLNTFAVLVSSRGARASVAARYLTSLGMTRVAAMDGGMAAWKALGYLCPRDENSYRKELFALAPGMGRDGKPLHMLENSGPLTREMIAEHIGDAHAVRWVKLAAFLLHGKRSCVDGRDDHGVIGTPGGDAGELLLGLVSAEKISGRALDRRAVARILERYVDTFGRFYMHTDMTAMNHLIVDELRKDERVAPHLGSVFQPEEWRAWFAAPPVAAREALLDHLQKAECMGCGHLRGAMSNPAYGVRPELARDFLRAFHELRWAGAPELEWVVLGGDHFEGAVANVLVDGDLHGYTRVPLVSPSVHGRQMFVNHPQVTRFLRSELASWLAETDICKERDLQQTIEAIGTAQAGLTLGALAKGLPLFELHFPNEGAPSVKQTGTIG